MRDMVSKLAGCRVEESENDFEISVVYSLTGREGFQEVRCIIVTDPSSRKFVGVKVENFAVEIEDIVSIASETNDLTFVVTELQFRLNNFFKRSREFEDLEER